MGGRGSLVCIPQPFKQTPGFLGSMKRLMGGGGDILMKQGCLWPQVVKGSHSSVDHADTQGQSDSRC